MGVQRFDAAVIAVSRIERRGVLAGVTAAVAALRGGFQVEAACKTTNKKCSAKAQCCSGKCKGGRCACIKDGKRAETADLCCSGDLTGGVCGACGPATCPDGCCGPSGCAAGTTRSNCGGNGESCDTCAEAFTGCCDRVCAQQELTVTTTITSGGMSGPFGVAVTASDLLFVGNELSMSLSRFTRTGSTWTADGGPFTVSGLVNPMGMAAGTLSGVETLFIAEANSNTVAMVQSLASTPVIVGSIGSAGSGPAQFSGIRGVAYRVHSGVPTLYAADASQQRISIWTHNGTSWAQVDEITGVGAVRGVAVDINGKVFTVANNGLTATIMTATKSAGTWSVSTYLTESTTTFQPNAIVLDDERGVFHVADLAGSRVMVWDKVAGSSTPITAVSLANTPYGLTMSGTAELIGTLTLTNQAQGMEIACP